MDEELDALKAKLVKAIRAGTSKRKSFLEEARHSVDDCDVQRVKKDVLSNLPACVERARTMACSRFSVLEWSISRCAGYGDDPVKAVAAQDLLLTLNSLPYLKASIDNVGNHVDDRLFRLIIDLAANP